MSNRNDIISLKICFDKSGYGSIKTTFEDAKKKDKTIILKDVKEFFDKNVEKKTQVKNYNSFCCSISILWISVWSIFINDLEDQQVKVGAI